MKRKPLTYPRAAEPEANDDIADYAARLRLLYYVPLDYIIPDEDMLPCESVRFFLLDENFIRAMTAGALSIGAATESDLRRDKALAASALRRTDEIIHMPRLEIMHPNHRSSAEERIKRRSEFLEASGKNGEEVLTGFIMRSRLVETLKGLSVAAFDENDSELTALRIDEISDDIAIGIFKGEISRLVISEPKTGLQFGLSEKSVFTPRDISDSEDKFGRPLDDKKIDMTDLISPEGCLDAESFAERLKDATGAEEVGSSIMAYQLIKTAGRGEFCRNLPEQE